MIDTRVAHTRQRLAAAILELASTTHISRISVAAIARKAQINRATFYDHFDSPSDLLTRTLARDFEAMQQRYLQLHEDAATPSEALRTGLQRLLVYVETRRTIYQRAFADSPDPGVTHMLSQAFSDACFTVLQETAHPPLRPSRARIIANFAAAGAIAGIGTWLRNPETTRDELIETLVEAFPKWWH